MTFEAYILKSDWQSFETGFSKTITISQHKPVNMPLYQKIHVAIKAITNKPEKS